MSYRGVVVEVPAGLAGMSPRDNRAHAQPAELEDAEGIEFTDGTIQKEPGAAFYNSGIAGTPVFTGSFNIVPISGWAGAGTGQKTEQKNSAQGRGHALHRAGPR